MDALRDSLLTLGLPGLFLIAMFDSAGIPLPGGVDIVLMLLAWQQPSFFLLVAFIAAVGSTLGCLVLYRIGRTGGEVAVRRLDPEKVERVTAKVRDNDVAAVMVALLAPPPFPTKVFMLVAGLVGMPWPRFAATVFVARMIRFSAEAYLAVRLGDRALEALQQNYPLVGAVLLGAGLLYVAIRWFRGRSAQAATS